MRYLFEMDLLLDSIHNLYEFSSIPVIFSKVLLQEKESE
jgi:hypothetical protein